jgi:hypothetical protein
MGSVLGKNNNRKQGVLIEEKLEEIGASLKKESNRIPDTIKCTICIDDGISSSDIATV